MVKIMWSNIICQNPYQLGKAMDKKSKQLGLGKYKKEGEMDGSDKKQQQTRLF